MCENQNFEKVNLTDLNDQDFKDLFVYFAQRTYAAKNEDEEANIILCRCIKFLERDYNIVLINNLSGELSANYPSRIPVIDCDNEKFETFDLLNEASGQRTTNTIYESTCDLQNLRDQFIKAKNARCRTRFPIPVIAYKHKYICRSATIAGGPEIYGRQSMDYFFPLEVTETNKNSNDLDVDWTLLNRLRSEDIRLLKLLQVDTIADLMVENKKVKFGVYVTSSEKIDRGNRYSDFSIMSLPYPGCEFFRHFFEKNFSADGLKYNWANEMCDANLYVPTNFSTNEPKIDWSLYKTWNLVEMTQNYVKYLIRYIHENNSGILIHCISGWDRTPLFISLIRLSLWADDLIHQRLSELEIFYFTVAYDWMFFGHHYGDRRDKSEEILFFCFYFLKYMTNDDFSVRPRSSESDNGLNVSPISRNSPISNTDESNGSDNFSNLLPINLRDEDLLSLSPSSKIRRTSPVAVPNSNLQSKNGCGQSSSFDNWTLVSSTGSVRSVANSDTQSQSTTSSVESNDTSRRSKLLRVRGYFYKYYFQSIGAKYGGGEQPSKETFLQKVEDLLEKAFDLLPTFATSSSFSPEPDTPTQ